MRWGPLAAGSVALVAGPAPAVVLGFQAAEGRALPWRLLLVALVGVIAGATAVATGRKRVASDDDRSSGAGAVMGWLALGGSAFGLAFYLLALLAPGESGLDAALLGWAGFAVAFLVGMISFFSPCILPLLPGYVSFVSGLSGEEMERAGTRRHVLAGTLLFVLGFATVFTAFGATASAIGGFLAENELLLNRIAGAIVIVMGIAFALPRLLGGLLEREARPLMTRVRPGVRGAYPLGLAFAVGWTPCVGPGLGVIYSLGLFQESVGRGALLLFFFSLGFGVWFILAGLGMRRALGASKWLRRRARTIQAVGGAFMVAIGLLLVTDQWSRIISPLRRMINSFVPPV